MKKDITSAKDLVKEAKIIIAKQEVIKEAYGEYWEEYQRYVNDNGWLTELNDVIHHCITTKGRILRDLNNKSNIEFEEVNNYLRPKSLQGIENNNGWIKIDNEEQHDEIENDYYWWYNIQNGDWEIGDKSTYGKYTHYQPIEKPKSPIY